MYRFSLFFLLAGCLDEPATGGPRIHALTPDPVAPGAPMRIEGEGFGAAGHVAIGGRPVAAGAWTNGHIDLVVPADQRPGRTLVVVVSAGVPTAPAWVEVSGTPRPRADGGRPLAPELDGGPLPDPDAGVDRGVPDASPGGPFVAEFLSDPAGMNDIRIAPQASEQGELVLDVVLPREAAARWGLAFHLAWDQGLMTLLSATPAGSPAGHAAEISPGRLAAGRLLDGRPTAFRLRFRLLGRGEGRLMFPPRYRTVRDRQNRPLPVGFAEGTLRVRAVGP